MRWTKRRIFAAGCAAACAAPILVAPAAGAGLLAGLVACAGELGVGAGLLAAGSGLYFWARRRQSARKMESACQPGISCELPPVR